MLRCALPVGLAALAMLPAAASANVTITVYNQARVRPDRLALVERALVIQSQQVARYWFTPTIRFGPGGWRLYLRGDCRPGGLFGIHDAAPSSFGDPAAVLSPDGDRAYLPYGIVWACGTTYAHGWGVYMSHEVMEMLADPTLHTVYSYDHTTYLLEIADAVYDRSYPIRVRRHRVSVSDFVLPSWYAGAQLGRCSDEHCSNQYLAPATNDFGPYDYTGVLRLPWQTEDPCQDEPFNPLPLSCEKEPI